MRTEIPQWASNLLQKSARLPLQVISGQSSKLQTGTVMKATAEAAQQPGTFRISLAGEPFTVKGLPRSAQGKLLSFIAQKSAGGKVELLWLGNIKNDKGKQATAQQTATTAAKGAAQATIRNRSASTLQSTLLSPLPAGLKSGKTITARIDAMASGKMILTPLQSAAKGASSHPATAAQMITTPVAGLKTGQQVSLLIRGVNVNGKTTLEITPQPDAKQAGAVKTDAAQLPLSKAGMRPGDSALALVQKRLENGNIQINIRGVRVETAAPANIKAGDALEIKMTRAPAEFQVVQVHRGVSQKAQSLIRQNIATGNTPIAQHLGTIRNALPNINSSDLTGLKGFPQLETLLKSMESSRDYPVNGERLAQVIRDSGSSLEAKLQSLISKGTQPQQIQQDLKAVLMQIGADQQAGKIQNSEVLRIITELSQQSVSRIEIAQALNVLANVQGEPLRVEFPMLVGQQLISVQMSVQQQGAHDQSDRSDHASDSSYAVLFALELNGLGELRVDASVSDRAVHARIYNESSDVRHFIQEHIHRLEERLQALGFKEIYLLTSPLQPDAEKQQQFDELITMRPASFSLLDLLV